MEHLLEYTAPATTWVEALPLGNGHLGAMLFGGARRERIDLNDSSAWSGGPASADAPPLLDPQETQAILAETRAALDAGEREEATVLLRRLQHRHSQTFLPFARLDLEIVVPGDGDSPEEGYRRELDLAAATHSSSWRSTGGEVRTRSYMPHADDVLVHEVSTSDPRGLELRVRASSELSVLGRSSEGDVIGLLLRMPADVFPSHDEAEQPVRFSDRPGDSLEGALALGWSTDGEVVVDEGSLVVRGATRVRLLVATRTTWAGIGAAPVGTAATALEEAAGVVVRAAERDPGVMRREHIAAHGELYARVELALDAPDPAPVPTDERIRRLAREGGDPFVTDPGLVPLLFHYGRYLLICSSREGNPPATLQGIWNSELQPPWSSNYTTNVNVQMNYWGAESAALPECLPPLFDLIDGLARTGVDTARRFYDSPGWVAHHNTDVWAYSRPVGHGTAAPRWAAWPMAGPWLVRHLWERVLHGADDAFARERVWEPVRGAALFHLEQLQEGPDGALGTSPSTSPENAFAVPGGEADVAHSSSADLSSLRELFGIVAALAERLGLGDDPVAVRAAAALPRLAGPRIEADGTIAEWHDDVTPTDPHHRHLSQLYFAHPGAEPLTPELSRAVSASLDARGDDSTGWSLVWKMLHRARLGQGDRMTALIALLLRDATDDRGPHAGGVYPNLFAAHPPFQIDANLGVVAAVVEAFVQSHRDGIELLVAPPAGLGGGRLSGVIARPGVRVDLEWVDDACGGVRLLRATLESAGAPLDGVTVRYRGRRAVLPAAPRHVLVPDDFA